LVAGLLSLSLSACGGTSEEEAPKAACDPVCDANACQVCDTSGDTPLCVSTCGEGLLCQDGECVIPEDAQCDACDPCQYCDTSLDPAACVDFCADGTTCNETTNACDPVTPSCDPACDGCSTCDTEVVPPVCVSDCDDTQYCNEDGDEAVCMIDRTLGGAAPNKDHRTKINETSLDDGPAATATCMGCHSGVFDDMLGSAHWRWDDAPSPGLVIPGGAGGAGGEVPTTGKNALINNFCIAVEKNEARCAQCHAGYKFVDMDTYDWTDKANMDCLVCHADPASGYAKAKAPGGAVADGVDLVLAAKSVGTSTRANCGACHFKAGGGDNVKKGDIGSALANPTEAIDVHMGRGMTCADCHTSGDPPNHLIAGKGVHNPVAEGDGRVMCSDCHDEAPVHVDPVLEVHIANLACQTCHVPAFSRTQATKVDWKWETAGQFDTDPIPMQEVTLADGSTVMKPRYDWMKGDFVWDANVRPAYAWYDGGVERLTVLSEGFISGDGSSELDPIAIAKPIGDRGVGGAKLYPFKVMTGTQAVDLNATDGEFLIVPWLFSGDTTSDAFWRAIPRLFGSIENPTQADIDGVWDTALTEGALDADQITPPTTYKKDSPTGDQVTWDWMYTEMYMQINHEVALPTAALGCSDCHLSNWDANFGALTDAGYICDPMTDGGADACAPAAP
jgi:octaheme c-type cytochrome (tetrathionate reductase family)